MITLYDTALRQKVPLTPAQPGQVGIYVCGPTVYDTCHVGHARCYVAFDAVVRHLRASGLRVTYVRNVTDIDDKIIKRAQQAGEDPLQLADRFTAEFQHDMCLLGNRPPDVEPRVSGHLPQIIAFVGQLVASGHAYVVDGDVYYAVDRFPAYGGLSGRALDDLRAGARVDVNERKQNPLDFALWKAAKVGEPSWDSPWGPGRPGWHIECSAMSGAYLGARFDIHGGGMDLIFPHHENEVAQSRALHGEASFARHWMHNGFINIRGEKMSKSLGNFFTIREVCAHHEPEALRLFLLNTHYRSPLAFDIQHLDDQTVRFPNLDEHEKRLAYVYTTRLRLTQAGAEAGAAEPGEVLPPADTFADRFTAAMDDDFNSAAALGYTSDLLALANKLLDQPKAVAKDVRRRTLQTIAQGLALTDEVLGVFGQDPQAFLLRRRARLCRRREIDAAAVDAELARRAAARQAKDYATADTIRQALLTQGIEIMDTPAGATWRVIEDTAH